MSWMKTLNRFSLWLSFKNAQSRLMQEQLASLLADQPIQLIDHEGGNSFAVGLAVSNGLVWGVSQTMAVDIKAGQTLATLWNDFTNQQ